MAAKKHRCPEPEVDDSSRWLGTYGDAVTLLMAFFVMLYAMSEVDAQKFEAFVSGLEGPFGNTSITQTVLPTNSGLVGPATPADLFPQPSGELAPEVTVVPEDEPTTPPEGATDEQQRIADPEGDDDLTEVQRSQLLAVEQALDEALADIGMEGVADFRVTSRGLVVSIASDDVLFATGEARLEASGERIIETVAAVLTQYPNLVLVEGHTDDVPLQLPGYSNWNLSTDRAVTVVQELIDAHGFDPVRLGATGYADTRPRATNDTPANRALNRRVDVLVVAQGALDDG